MCDGEECECVVITWHTSRVFLNREEAREYGKARPYAWGKENEGWQIYGVPCEGEIASLLGAAGVNQAFIDERKG